MVYYDVRSIKIYGNEIFEFSPKRNRSALVTTIYFKKGYKSGEEGK